MSYEPTTWANGDIITATKLNNIESGVQSVSSSYTPTTWVNGDIITATKLNNIEQGIANAGGGGGSSDLSTAEVIVTDNTEDVTHEFFNLFNIDDDALINNFIITSGRQRTVTAVLYKNYLAAYIETSDTITVTGDIEYDSEYGDLYITGDGTITIS